MSSRIDFVEYVCEQARDAGFIAYKKMFGEFGIYCDNLIFGLICDDQFFVKHTIEVHEKYPQLTLAAPYQGCKPYLYIEDLDNQEILCDIIRITCQNIPIPKPKKPRKKKEN